MDFKEKIESTKEVFESFWRREEVERCLISVTAPRKGTQWLPPENVSLETKWLDVDYRIDRFKKEAETIYYGGETIPVFFPNLGPGVLAEFMGSPYELAKETVWFETKPMISDYEGRKKLALRYDTKLRSVMQELRKKCAKEGIFVTTTDLGGGLDIAASLRGTENLLMDMAFEPEEVRRLLEEIDECWVKTIEEIFTEDAQNQVGYSSWLPLWSSERFYPLQSDLSVNISTDMYEDLVLPELHRQSAPLGRVLYHLDGPGEIRHLDALLSLDRLDAIECVPLPDGRGYLDVDNPMWMDVYHRIQAAGKGLIIRMVAPDKIKTLLTSLSHRGLFVTTSAASEEEAEDLLKVAKTWAKEVKQK
ncbi:MAG: hypothetical protein K2L87_05985 [Clostridiales bacterium]|nr:hypothetical protein [Clostridiales bacterium]